MGQKNVATAPFGLQPCFFRPRFIKQPKTCDYRTDRSTIVLFNRDPRLGPIAAFKTQPKVSIVAAFKTRPKTYTLGHVLNVALPLRLGPRFKRGLMYRDMAALIKHGYSSNLRPRFKRSLRPCYFQPHLKTRLQFMFFFFSFLGQKTCHTHTNGNFKEISS